jgi:hypothetical protein
MILHLPRGAAALAALLAAAGAGGVAPTSGFIQYDQTMTAPRRPPMKMVDRLWFKGTSYRREDLYAQNKVLTMNNAAGTYVVMPGSSGAVELAAPAPRGATGRPVPAPRAGTIPGLMFLDAAAVARTARKVGTEKVGRYTADVYETRVRMPKTQGRPPKDQITRYWVSREQPIPVKVLMKSAPETQTVSVLKTAQFNIPIPDRLFQLPKGTKVRVLSPPGR